MKTLTRLLSTVLVCALITAIFLYRSSLADTSLVVDDFTYTTGQLTTVSAGTWVNFSGTGNFIQVSGGSLTYAGYPSSGVGNKIDIISTATSADDVYRQFATQTSGTTYAAFLVNVTNTTGLALNTSANGDLFAGFLASSSTSNFASRVSIRLGTVAGTYQLGLRASGVAGNTAVFSAPNLNPGTTYLVVISYQIIAGATNDVTNMWINPTLGGAQPVADLTQVSAADIPDVARFFVRQGTTTTPNASIDGVRVSDSWQSATSLQFRSAASGNWNSPATWESSADGTTWIAATTTPTSASAEAITVRSPHTVTVTAAVNADQLTVDAGGTLAVTSTLTNDGTTTINGSFQFNTGGVAAGNEFVYGPTGSLIYNHTGPDYVIGFVDTAWPFSGGPFNVTLQNGGGVNLNDFRDVFGTLSLLNGTISSAFNMNMGNGATIVRRAGGGFAGGSPGFDTNVNVIYDGTVALTTGSEIPSTSSILQNLTVTNTGGVTLGASATANATTVIGAGASLATGAFTFTNSGTTTVNGSFRIDQGGFANGNNFSYDPVIAALIFNNSSGSFVVSGTPAYWPAVNGPQNVTVQGSAGITVNVPRTVGLLFQYAAGVSNMGNLTLNGTSQVNTGGFTSGSPTYGAASLLRYNTGGTYGRNGEWLPGAVSGAGYPHDVRLSGNTTLDLPNTSSTFPFQMSGSLLIDSGSELQMGGTTPMTQPLTILGSVTNLGILTMSTSPGGGLNVGGNWSNAGTFTPNINGVNFNGPSGQTISGNTTFFNFTKSTAGAQQFNFTAGSITTVTNSLTLTGASGNLLSLRSTINGSPWNLSAPATQNVNFVDAKDSNASGGQLVTATNSVDSGGNTNWSFGTPDYTVTTTANVIVVTDASGNGDVLTVSEPAAGFIKFAAPGRFFSVNGGAAINGDSGNITLASVTSITINQENGSDTLNLGASSTTFPSLTINGGNGDDIVNLNGSLTFLPAANLDIDLQNDTATPGTDSVNFAASAQVFLNTTGMATIKVSRNVSMLPGSTFQVTNNLMTIEANQQVTPTGGDFNGIDINGGSIFTVGTGNVMINGKGGAGNFIENTGVNVSAGGQITSTNTGTLAVQGTGGAGSGGATAGQGNIGVYLTGSGSTIKSAASATQVTGVGGATNDSNVVGVAADELATIETNGAGTLTINGTGGTVNGGGTTAVNSAGVFIVVGTVGNGGQVKSTGTGVNAGNIIITGTATNGGAGAAQGVRVDNPASITTVDGNISITGTSAACSNACLGTSIRGSVTASGIGGITITGTGGVTNGAFPVHGVNVRSSAAGNGLVQTISGNIVITGTGGSGSTSNDNAGVNIAPSGGIGTVSTTGSGTITIITDRFTIPGAAAANIIANSSSVTLRQKTNSTPIDLGSTIDTTPNTLELSSAEIQHVFASTINFGDANSGTITVTANIQPISTGNLVLTSGANINIPGGPISSNGGNVTLVPGSAAGTNVFPSRSGSDVTLTPAKTLSLTSAKELKIVINTATVDSGYTQLNVLGLVNLNSAILSLSGSHVPTAGQQFVIVSNDSNDPITGTFLGFPEGATISNFLGSGLNAKISYFGGTGNDAVLTVQSCPTTFNVNSNLDTSDVALGDGLCATSGAVCTLRAAIEEANATSSGCGPININFSLPTSTITVASVLSITHSVNINGPVASSITVTGTAASPTRVFQTNTNTTVNISNLTVSGGRAGVGAGLMALGPNSTTNLNGMLFTGNIAVDPAGFAGGGGAASGNSGTLNIYNSTFSGNTGTHGGAISVQSSSPLNLVNVTITNNLADGNTGSGPCPIGGSVDGDGGGIQGSSMPAIFLNIRNSIVAFNQDCNSNQPNVTGLIINQGNNIMINDPSLNLGPLQNNGGPTLTYGLLAFSTAIDAGNDCVFTNTCVPALGVSLTNDQRGPAFPRQVNGDTVPGAHVDIGAFEKQAPSASNSVISGRIVDSGGTPVEGAAIRLSGAQDRLTMTDKEGNYRFEEVATNGFYTVTPSRANFSFAPLDRNFTQLGSQTDALFTATSTGGSANPLDTTEYFVRQQYLDFLGREPDEAGLSFWVDNINACGNNALCRSAKREDTSAAFFLSIEFHETGYLVYRAYQSAYGNSPGTTVPLNLAEFRPDTAQISEDLIVNAPGWQAKLEANKQAYFAAFVARSRFTSAYANTLTPAEFVDRLFANTHVTPSADDRAAVVAEFANAENSSNPVARAHALRRVAENSALARQRENQAFVLMQYFGYLGRDPNASPDGNFLGYDFWLHKLEEFNGDFRRAEMVKAFLVAGEYRSRFAR